MLAMHANSAKYTVRVFITGEAFSSISTFWGLFFVLFFCKEIKCGNLRRLVVSDRFL